MLKLGECRFDSSGRYRYWLQRGDGRVARNLAVAFVMLNPSTADEGRNDPTIRRCIAFAEQWGYDRLDVMNLFAFRATKPEELEQVDDPVGKQNDAWLATAEGYHLVICGWGNHGDLMGRARDVSTQLRERTANLKCFGLTKSGHPKHPLYLPRDANLVDF